MLRRFRTLALITLALLLVPTALARADAAYDLVAGAYATGGAHLDACAFTQAQLEAALAGIPPTLKGVIPDLKRAMKDGIAAHKRGECAGREPGTATTPGAPAGGGAVPPVTTTPATPITPPPTTSTTPGQVAPPTAAPTTPGTTTQSAPASAADGSRTHDRTPLVVALIALGALLLLALAIWGWARARGWDPTWATRTRHAWGEAGFRTTSTWSEFTDWLRLGR